MSAYYYYSSDTEIQGNGNIQTEFETESYVPNLPYETDIQDDNSVETSDDDLLSDSELMYDNEVVGDLLTKMKIFIDKIKEETFEKTNFILEWQIFNDFFNLIEKHENNLTDDDLSALKSGLKLYIRTISSVDPNYSFIADLNYSKEIYYTYFKLFNIDIIQNYLKNTPMSNRLKFLCRICISRILLVMIDNSGVTYLGLNDLQRPTNCLTLLSLMLNYIKTDLESSDLALKPSFTDASITRQFLLSVLECYSDKVILVRDLIEIGCLEIMINALKMICKTVAVDILLQDQITTIIYNISRHDDGIKQLNALNAAEIIQKFQTNNKDILLNIKCCMTLALLSTPEEIKKDGKSMNAALDTLLEIVYNASASSNHYGDGFHISEVLIVFVKLFNDDRILDYIMEQSKVDLHTPSTTEFFINQLMYYHSKISDDDSLKQVTCTALVNILWSVSFQDRYKQELKNAGTRFKELIKKLTGKPNEKISPNQYVPQYIENIQKAAAGLLFNIDALILPPTEPVCGGTSTVLDKNQKPMIMISYSHEDTEFCKQLYNEILKKGYDIWIDFKFLKAGDLWEQIAAGMKRANVIICLMSEGYCKSKSCRWEATYALDKLQATKSIIPVFLQKHELPDWLGIRISVLKHIRFHDLKQLENDKLFELIDMIENSLSLTAPRVDLGSHPSVLSTHHEPEPVPMAKINKPTLHSNNILSTRHDELSAAKSIVTKLENQHLSSKSSPVLCTTTKQSLYPEKPIEQWNKNDISQWFQHNEILPELRDLCHFEDGYELLDYAKIFLDTEKLQYQMYASEFSRPDGITLGKKPLLLHEFTKFSHALQKLRKYNKST